MAVWKQFIVTLLLAIAAVIGWGALDPGARPRLVALGVPEILLPEAVFLAAAPAETATGAPGQGPSTGTGQGRAAGGRGPGGFGGPVTVVTASVFEAETNDRVSAIGTGEAIRTVTLIPRSSGMVDEILFEAGDRVEAGQPLVRLDKEAEEIALRLAELQVEDARAKMRRYDQLVANNTLAEVDRDTARTELASAELALRDARLQLDRREIRAPFAGVVGLTDVEPGDMVSATTEIAVLDDRSELKMTFRVPEAFAARVRQGQEVIATTPSLPGERFTGTVTALGSRIEEDSRTLVVQAALENVGDKLRPGMSFAVTLAFAGERRTAVPALAVQWDRNGSFVWRVAGDAAERVGVTILERGSEQVLVSGELAIDDLVVVEGVQRLRPGAKVALADDGGTSPPGAGPSDGQRRS